MNIGTLQLDRPLMLAPMEDVTDTPFRLICKGLGADVLFTEFTSSEALIRDAKRALHKIMITDAEQPIGIQIVGAREEAMEHAARVATQANPAFIDINCGCWVRNHAMRGEGAGLLKDIKKMRAVIRATVRSTRLPVTVKTRLGWDENSIIIEDVARMCEDEGVAMLTVHCRTRSQAGKGTADWSWLSKIRTAASIPLVGNGDVKTPEDAKQMFELGCDGVMIGRGAVHNPWIFQQTKEVLLTGRVTSVPSLDDKIALCLEHLRLSVLYKGQRRGIVDFRKHFTGYFHGIPNAAKLRAQLASCKTIEEIEHALGAFARVYRQQAAV